MTTFIAIIDRFSGWSTSAYVLGAIVLIAFVGILINGLTKKGNK